MRSTHIFFIAVISILLSSCSSMIRFDKRKYLSGHYHERNSNARSAFVKDIGKNGIVTVLRAQTIADQKVIKEESRSFDRTRLNVVNKGSVRWVEKVNALNKADGHCWNIFLESSKVKVVHKRFSYSRIGETDEEMDKSTKCSIIFTWLGFISLLIVGLLFFGSGMMTSAVIPFLFIGGICLNIGFVFACIASHQHRDDEKKYKGRSSVRFSIVLGVIEFIFLLAAALLIAAFNSEQ